VPLQNGALAARVLEETIRLTLDAPTSPDLSAPRGGEEKFRRPL
jgi:hypothetical protein